MKKIGLLTLLLFALVFVVTLLVSAPATLLAKLVEQGSKGQFVLANAAGTVWKGSATPAIQQKSGKLFALDKLHWDVAVLQLLTGKLVLSLKWDNVPQTQSQPMLATLTLNQLELRNLILPLQAGVLGELTPMLRPVQLSGLILIKSEMLTLGKQGVTGSALADWTQAASILSPVRPLGNYRLEMLGAGDKLDLSLNTQSGMLVLEGQGNFTQGRGLQLQASARAAPEANGRLDELLRNLGPESSPGVHTLNVMR